MTLLRTSCQCGEVDISPESVILGVEKGLEHPEGWYAFCCPDCGDIQVKHADRRTLPLLIIAGVEVAWA